MKPQTAHLISSLEALFTTNIAIAESQGLDTLPLITVGRARTLLADLRLAKAEAKRPKANPTYFKHLDDIHA